MNRTFFLAFALLALPLGAAEIHVSCDAASPGDGSAAAPFPSIQAGVNAAGPGDTVTVHPGTYFEKQIVFPRSGRSDAPITVRSVEPGKAVIDGSRPVREWVRNDKCGFFTADVPEFDPAEEARANPIWTRFGDSPAFSRWLFVEGVPIQRVRTANELFPGSFCLDYPAKKILWMPAPGQTPGRTDVRISVNAGIVLLNQRESIAIEGFRILRTAGWARGMEQGNVGPDIAVSGCRDIRITGNTFEFSASNAVKLLACTGCTVENNRIFFPGHVGIFVGGSSYQVTIRGNRITGANWRRINPHWEAGALKSGRCIDLLICGNEFDLNYGGAQWSDLREMGLVVEKNIVHDNDAGLFQESGRNNCYQDNLVYNNGRGIQMTAASDNLIRRNVLVNNGIGINLVWAPQYATLRTSTGHMGELESTLYGPRPGDLAHRRKLGMTESRILDYERGYLGDASSKAIMPAAWNLVWENLFYENEVSLQEYRDYRKVPSTPAETRLAAEQQNYSDLNWFVSKNPKTIHSASGVYESFEEWKKVTGRDEFSKFLPALEGWPEWSHWAEAEVRKLQFNPYGEVARRSGGMVPSPCAEFGRMILLRAKDPKPFRLSEPDVTAFVFEYEGQRSLLLYNTIRGTRKAVRLFADASEVTLREAYGSCRRLPLKNGILDIGVTDEPLLVSGVGANIRECDDIKLSRTGATEKDVRFLATFRNPDASPRKVTAEFFAPAGFSLDRNRVELVVPPRESRTAEIVVSATNAALGGVNACFVMQAALNGGEPVARNLNFKLEGKKKIALPALPASGEWRGKEGYRLAEVSGMDSIIGDRFKGDRTSYTGPEDLTAEISGAWSPNALHLFFRIRDEKLLTKRADANPWNRDSVEVFCDFRSDEGRMNEKISQGCLQIIVPAPVDAESSEHKVIECGRRWSDEEAAAIRTQAVRTGDGYNVELTIPFSEKLFPAGNFAEKRIVRLAAQINDADLDPDKVDFIFGWCDPPVPGKRNFENNTAWKELVFTGGAVVNKIGRPMIFIDGRHQGIPLRDAKTDSEMPITFSKTEDSLSVQRAFSGGDWQCLELVFTPGKSGRVSVVPHVDGVRRDKDGKLPYAWFYCDDITVEGAELKNGGFEDSSDSFKPWAQFGPGDVKSILTEDAYGVHSGKRALKLFAGAPVGQGIQVTENVPVTIRMWCRKPIEKDSK